MTVDLVKLMRENLEELKRRAAEDGLTDNQPDSTIEIPQSLRKFLWSECGIDPSRMGPLVMRPDMYGALVEYTEEKYK